MRTNSKWLLVLAAIHLVFFWKIVFTNQFSFLIDWDNANQIYPWTQFVARTLHEGHLPWWDPYSFSGQPFAGEMQTGLFDPLKFPLYLWPASDSEILPPRSIDLQMVFAHLLACGFMFALAREVDLCGFASLVAAVSFGLGGFVGNLRWPGMLDSALWLPLIFLLVWKALRAGSAAQRYLHACLAGVCLGLAVLAGSLHIVIADIVALGGAALFLALSERDPRRTAAVALGRAGATVAVAVGVGLLVGAIQLLPSLEYGSQSVRWVGGDAPMPSLEKIPYDLLGEEAALPPRSLLAFVLGGVSVGSAEYSPYQGVLPLLLVVAGVWKRWDHPLVRLLTILAITSVFYAWGAVSILHGFLYAIVPFLDKAREAGRLLYLTHFATALLAGFGAQAILASAAQPPQSWAAFLRAVKWAAVLLAFAVCTAALARPETPDHLFVSLALLVPSYAVLLFASRSKSVRSVQWTALALIVADLAAFYTPIKNQRQQSRAGTNSLESIVNARPLAEFFRSQHALFRVNIEPEEIRNLGDLYSVYALKGGAATMLADYHAFTDSVRGAQRLLNVRYTVTRRQPPGEQPVYSLGGWRVYEHSNYCPRAWLVHEIEQAPGVQEVFARISEESFDPLRQVVLSESLEPLPTAAQLGDAVERVEIRAYRPGFAEIEVRSSRPGVLIVSESFYPGWQALLNGQLVPLHRANGVLMGLAAPAGTNSIVMRYSPLQLTMGAWVTALTLAGVGLYALLVLRGGLRQRVAVGP